MSTLVVFAYISIRLVKKLVILVQFVLEESLAKRHLYFSFARVSALPPIEANDANDFVNIVYHTLDDDRGLRISCIFEELCKRRFTLLLALTWWRRAFGCNHVACKIQQLFQKLDAR